VIGVDAHKRAHTLVATDELGRELAAKTLAATGDGHLAAIAWAKQWPRRRSAAASAAAPTNGRWRLADEQRGLYGFRLPRGEPEPGSPGVA
jgi:hypothetical protein